MPDKLRTMFGIRCRPHDALLSSTRLATRIGPVVVGCMIPPMPEPERENRKHGFFSNQWKRRSILIGLGIHFSLWWALSVWFWTSYWGQRWSSAAWNTLIAPVELGIFYLQPHGVWRFGVAGLVVSGCLLGLTVVSATTRKRWTVVLTHVCVPLYWFYRFLLMGFDI